MAAPQPKVLNLSLIHIYALDEVLVARAAMYGLLQRVFSDVPDRALAENESCEVMDQCFEV